MEQDGVAASAGEQPQVMAAVEDGPAETLVLADVTRDGAHLRVPLAEAASLPEWR